MASSRRYVCVSVGYFDHAKTLRLVDRLGEPAFAYPIMLWAYASVNQTDGDFSDEKKYPSFVMSRIFKLHFKDAPGQVKRICEELERCGFFEPGTRKLHDWQQWNGYHEERSARGKAAAAVRWKRAREAERETDPPPEKKRAPRVAKKVHPDQGTNQRQQTSAKKDTSTAQNAGKPQKTAQTEREKAEKFKERMDAERQLKAIRALKENHPARPGNATLWKSEAEKKRSKEDYWQLNSAEQDLLRKIATL